MRLVPREPQELENELGDLLETRKDRCRSVEQGPAAHFTMGSRKDDGTGRLGLRGDADQATAFLELAAQPIDRDLGRPVEKNHVEATIGRIEIGRASCR